MLLTILFLKFRKKKKKMQRRRGFQESFSDALRNVGNIFDTINKQKLQTRIRRYA